MPIIRHAQERNFTALPNSLLQDKRLELRDVGLLCFMLSLPPNWEFSTRGLDAILPNDGEGAIRASLKRLEACGYLHRKRTRSADGKLSSVVWIVTDEPCVKNPHVEKPHVDEPHEGNRAQYKETNTQYYTDKVHKDERGDRFERTDRICGASSSECSDGDAWDALYN